MNSAAVSARRKLRRVALTRAPLFVSSTASARPLPEDSHFSAFLCLHEMLHKGRWLVKTLLLQLRMWRGMHGHSSWLPWQLPDCKCIISNAMDLLECTTTHQCDQTQRNAEHLEAVEAPAASSWEIRGDVN